MKKILIFLMLFVSFVFAKVNLNTATVQELEQIKGIGAKKALEIIKYRKEHNFTKLEDIMKVKGIGKKLFEKIKNDIEIKSQKNNKKKQ